MSWNSIQDRFMTVADAGVWFFIAFVGVQIGVVIVSTLMCRRKILSAIRQVETSRLEIVGQIKDVCEEPSQERIG